MKRVIGIISAVAILLLMYPSAYLLAGPPSSSDQLHVITGQNQFIQPPNPTSGDDGSGGGDDDRGDADDLAGVKYGTRPPAHSIERDGFRRITIPALRTWWMYFFIHKLY